MFRPDEGKETHLILLHSRKGRWDFPELKQVAKEELRAYNPDSVIIEAKASGTPLIQELRRFGVYATAFSPNRGQDKHVRLNTVSPIFEAGHVWRPDTEWAEEVQEEIASFPYGEHDDLVDATTLALLRYRQGSFVRLYDDEEEEPIGKRKYEYY